MLGWICHVNKHYDTPPLSTQGITDCWFALCWGYCLYSRISQKHLIGYQVIVSECSRRIQGTHTSWHCLPGWLRELVSVQDSLQLLCRVSLTGRSITFFLLLNLRSLSLFSSMIFKVTTSELCLLASDVFIWRSAV